MERFVSHACSNAGESCLPFPLSPDERPNQAENIGRFAADLDFSWDHPIHGKDSREQIDRESLFLCHHWSLVTIPQPLSAILYKVALDYPGMLSV